MEVNWVLLDGASGFRRMRSAGRKGWQGPGGHCYLRLSEQSLGFGRPQT